MSISPAKKLIAIALVSLSAATLAFGAAHAQVTSNTNANGVSSATSPGSVTSSSASGSSLNIKLPTTVSPGGSSTNACLSIGGGVNWTNCFNVGFANLINIFLNIAAFILTIAGEIMNVSIILTLHIKDFVDATPAIYTVWQAIRDITGLFFIFYLLYAAIQMILGEEQKFGHTITNIVITGIVINFSFFLVSVGIDASNIASQAIYNQMFPNKVVTIQSGSTLSSIVQQAETQGHISDIFMNSLQVSKLYDPQTNNGNGGVVTGGLVLGPLKIILIGVAGVMMMVTTALSFIVAAGAFIIRLVVLLFVLAFSPLLCLSWMSPELQEQSKDVWKHLKSQLIFMPVYLLLMYVALRILNDSNILGAAATQGSSFMPTGTNWAFPFIILSVNFILVIFMLNLPLVVGISMSGHMSKAIKKFSAANIWKNFGSQVGSRTLGRAAYSANERLTPWLASKSPLVGSLSNSALSSVSKAGFGVKKGGYEDKLKAKKEAQEKLHKKIGEVDETRFSTKAEADVAKDRAKQYQAAYRSKLSWSGKVGGVIGFMVDNRANRQTQKKLDDEVKKKSNAKNLKANKKAKSDKEDELKELNSAIEDQSRGVGFKPGIPPTTEQIAKKKKLEDEIKDLEKKIDDGEDQKHQEELDDIAGKVKDKNKDSGGDKEEKKEEGGKEKK